MKSQKRLKMIERKIVAQKIKEYEIEEYIRGNLKRVGLGSSQLKKTPLGDKVILSASRPGLVVGKKGQNIKLLTKTLKKKFGLENPEIEINEVTNPNLDAQIIAERIANSLERFGSARFKGVGHKVMEDVMGAGALGIEILISGKVPSTRAKRWRFYQGYLKKSGDVAIMHVRKSYAIAQLKSGVIGIQVRIMPPDTQLPDKVLLIDEEAIKKQESEVIVEEIKEEKNKKIKKSPVKKQPRKKSLTKKNQKKNDVDKK
jgi:small subunit ribosomal protein S3